MLYNDENNFDMNLRIYTIIDYSTKFIINTLARVIITI